MASAHESDIADGASASTSSSSSSFTAFISADDFGVDVPPRCPTRLGFRLDQVPEESSLELEQDSDCEEAEAASRKNKTRRFFLEDDSETRHPTDEEFTQDTNPDSSFTCWRYSSGLESEDDSSSDDSDSESLSDEDQTSYQIVFPPPPTKNVPCTSSETHIPEPVRPTAQTATTPENTSSLPIPLSPSAKQALRLAYPHHGFSRSALMHQKWFWSSRHDEWVEWQARQDECKLRAGDAENSCPAPTCSEEDPHSRSPSSGLDRDVPVQSQNRFVQNMNAPIYPRIGDVTALRDAYSVNVDRCFCQFPLWTIHKMLYLFDMHQRVAQPEHAPKKLEDTPSQTHSEAEDTEYIENVGSSQSLSTFIDDDKTLVEDESPFGSPKKGSVATKLPEPVFGSGTPAAGYFWNGARPWELSWYARWELLIGLVQRDQALRHASMQAVVSASTDLTATLAEKCQARQDHDEHMETRPSIIYFSGENGEDDDDEEDYGTVVTNPLFAKPFEHGYECAGEVLSGNGSGTGVEVVSRMLCV
ncbi:hypothetical protein SERLA73DRAFT_69788 [Serpula lacrymans var. lacrymans S7.3]|uniref:Uncharacterized protein n=2 Tax=Serpula lacrymans var. lacrymans TaxID=341189 RepID=F8PL81_SERL3|nr:uncharacterized protein SERLADRAFT_433852 [Serpula lacrymans var. lacrymans S7.9]EGO03989.1 hypothetical protein SERLA73DRAFT_69788 [Serpula lacrymans var. lacrymans S7.3]EGO29909.1 hypothetical protein SERLADRAFT_433852 [Serpula lacrymans var. lacrymans S7.9]